MKKSVLFIVLFLLNSISMEGYADRIFLPNEPIYEWKTPEYNIKLRKTYRDTCDLETCKEKIIYSYILQINKPISGTNGLIFLQFLDDEGFPLNYYSLRVAEGGYTGIIKGLISIYPEDEYTFKNFKAVNISYTPEIGV